MVKMAFADEKPVSLAAEATLKNQMIQIPTWTEAGPNTFSFSLADAYHRSKTGVGNDKNHKMNVS